MQYIYIYIYVCVCVYMYIYTQWNIKHNGILLSHKKNEILPSAMTWKDIDDVMLSELNQRKTNTI